MVDPAVEYRTAYRNAVLRGSDDLVALLAEARRSTEVTPGDHAVAALARGERPGGPAAGGARHQQQEVVILAALGGHLEPGVEALGAGFFGHVGGGPPGTLLHHAAWVGSAALARVCSGAAPIPSRLRRGVRPPLRGRRSARSTTTLAGRDYVAVADHLVAAGARVEPHFAEVAEGPLAEWLEDWV